LFLIRHAETDYFTEPEVVHGPDTPLTAEGRKQAARLEQILSGIRFDRVICSGTLRSIETASLATGRESSGFEVWPDLREIESGRLDALTPEQVEGTFSTFLKGVASATDTLFGGETIADLLDRVYGACERLRNDPTWDSALLVLHGVVNRAILSWAIVGPDKRLFFGGLEQGPGCVNIVDIGDADVVIRTINYMPEDPLQSGSRSTTMEALRQRYSPPR
jgi:probable phosphoglycerate mutase